MFEREYDYIIVGAGPAGCVLAARLTEDGGRSVLLLDAGPDYGPDPAAWPADLLDPSGSQVDTHSWGYLHRVSGAAGAFPLPRARVVGGCSAINGCIWLRGSRADYDLWESLGNPGWGFDDLLPYFKRAESDPDGEPGIHGHDGPVCVFRAPDDALTVIDRAFVAAADELGLDHVVDLNGAEQQSPGYGRTPKNIVDGYRFNTALSYLNMARGRPNLTILPDTLVDRLILDGRVARGVVTVDGRELRGREMIVSSGSYASPALLMRSGIGPASHLQQLGIPIVHDLPGVGGHLLDHPLLAPYTSQVTTFPIAAGAQPDRRIFIQVMIRARSRQVDDEIDLHLYPRESFDEVTGRWLYGIGISLQYARSHGRVRLTSRDPGTPLDIDHRYFSDPADLEAMCDGLDLVHRLATTAPLAHVVDVSESSWRLLGDRDALRDIVRRETGTTFHPSSTCRMGPLADRQAVVDVAGRVHGIERLRVVDASIFPASPRCNLHWPVIAVAERMADLMTLGEPRDAESPHSPMASLRAL